MAASESDGTESFLGNSFGLESPPTCVKTEWISGGTVTGGKIQQPASPKLTFPGKVVRNVNSTRRKEVKEMEDVF